MCICALVYDTSVYYYLSVEATTGATAPTEELDHRLRFEIEEITLQMQVAVPRRTCVLQCVAVCCSVLQCVAVCCSVLQCVAVAVPRRTYPPR